MCNSQNNQLYKSDLDLDLMTLVLKLALDMVKMFHHTKNEVSMSRYPKVIAKWTDRHTDRRTDTHTDSMKTLPYRIRDTSFLLFSKVKYSKTCHLQSLFWTATCFVRPF